MYKRIVLILICFVFTFVVALANQARDNITRVVVFDFKNGTEHIELGRQVAEMSRVIIPGFKGFEVIDRGIMKAKISEKGMNIDEITDSGTGSEVGKLFDSDFFIVGNIGRLGNVFSLNIKLIDSETGSVIIAEGLEFESLVEVRKIVRGILSNILGYGGVAGKPVIDEEEFEKLKKDTSIALSLSIGSTIVQAAALGVALSIPEEDDPTHIWSSLALLVPPVTPIYTEDWGLAPYTIGFSVGGGVFNFVGRSLIENAGGDAFRNIFGVVLVIAGGGAKIYSVVLDILNSTSSVENYNNSLEENYFITENIRIYPTLADEYAGLGVVARF